MPSLDDRVAYLEGYLKDHEGTVGDLRSGFHDLRDTVRELREQMNRRFDRFETRLSTLDRKVDHHFMWLVGIQVTMFVAMIGAFLATRGA
jgi:hypothetical protein